MLCICDNSVSYGVGVSGSRRTSHVQLANPNSRVQYQKLDRACCKYRSRTRAPADRETKTPLGGGGYGFLALEYEDNSMSQDTALLLCTKHVMLFCCDSLGTALHRLVRQCMLHHEECGNPRSKSKAHGRVQPRHVAANCRAFNKSTRC